MIGKIYSTVFPYYDSKTQKNSFKKRPVLIIGGPRNNDYTVLPISTVTKKANLDSEYDLEINPANYPLLHLDKLSYVRVHKQTMVHKVSLTSLIGDMKTEYADLYLSVLEKLEEFNKRTIDNAL